jgi:hypothetical protein
MTPTRGIRGGLRRAGLKAAGWTKAELEQTAKGHLVKVSFAGELRASRPITRAWIAERLKIGSASYLSALLSDVSKN